MARWIPLLSLLCTFTVACTTLASSSSSGRAPYPEEWWTPVAKDGAPSWEILPQEAGPGEVILSKRTELGILSNFAATPFDYDGKRYASVEGFWQMLKYPEGPGDERLKVKWPHTREEVAAMTAFDAKDAGKEANAIMKQLGIDWVTYRGKRIAYRENAKGDFYSLILAAEWEKLKQNPQVREILLKTGDLVLRPDHQQSANEPPAWKYHEIWMEIRRQL